MTDLASSSRPSTQSEEGAKKTSVIDVDVHEMLRSNRDLVPYLEEPWRNRVEIPDGWQGIPGLPYSYPQVGGVAMADAATSDGAPAGSSYEQMREQLLDQYDVEHVCS